MGFLRYTFRSSELLCECAADLMEDDRPEVGHSCLFQT